jgi:cytoskeletal protein CcmA (bactofilin family)
MWNRKDPTPPPSTRTEAPSAPVSDRVPAQEPRRTENLKVNIGQSIHIKGELTGNEDLTIDGRVEGTITLKDHHLTIGKNGRIQAGIQAKSVKVDGNVEGDISADELVEISANGSQTGDITAPRIIIADGARFKGTVDMDKGKKAPAAFEPKAQGAGKVGGPA